MEPSKIWAVGGGKGGVGKSVMSGNLGIALAQRGYRVVLVDGDLGGANLHTCLGVTNPERGLSDFITRQVPELKDVVLPTSVPNLGLISGAQDILNIANPKHAQKVRLLKAIQELEAEFILLDLGAGTSFNTLDFFLLAEPQIIVVIPEPTSIENAYRFIKSALYRKLRQNAPNNRVAEVIDSTSSKNNPYNIRTPQELLTYLREMSEDSAQFVQQQVESFRPKLILNQIRSKNDVRIGFAMDNACSKYFGVHLDFVGYMEHDEVMWQSIVQRQPLLTHFPQSHAAQKIRHICENLLHNQYVSPQTL